MRYMCYTSLMVDLITKVNKLSPAERGYIAGIIDGEGSITLEPRRNRKGYKCRMFRVDVSSTDEELIDWLVEKVGGAKTLRKHAEGNRKTQWSWSVRGRDVVVLLRSIKPYFQIYRRKARADFILEELQHANLRPKTAPQESALAALTEAFHAIK